MSNYKAPIAALLHHDCTPALAHDSHLSVLQYEGYYGQHRSKHPADDSRQKKHIAWVRAHHGGLDMVALECHQWKIFDDYLSHLTEDHADLACSA